MPRRTTEPALPDTRRSKPRHGEPSAMRRAATSAWSAGGGAMPQRLPFVVRKLTCDDVDLFRDLLAVMGDAFGELETYTGAQPDTAYLRKLRSEEHTSELQSLMRISYAVFCLKKKKTQDR